MLRPGDKIDETSSEPRHIQVQRILRANIESGFWKPNDKLPAEVMLALELGVSKMTANKAILALVAEGLLVRGVGRGTFVALPEAKVKRERLRVTIFFAQSAADALNSDYYQPLYLGISEMMEGAGVDIAVAPFNTGDYAQDAQRFPSDGYAIFAPRTGSADSIRALAAQGTPVVVAGASWENAGVPMVDSDNRDGAKKAVARLVQFGHRRIVCLYAEPDTANTRDRLAGYRDALADADIIPDPACEIEGMAVWQLGETARQRLLGRLRDETDRVTAIFGAGHYIALEGMKTAQAAGLRVPEDVSFIGFDNPLSAWHVFPSLTTVEQPLFEMGRRAGERLLLRLQGEPSVPESYDILPTRLVERSSAAQRTASL